MQKESPVCGVHLPATNPGYDLTDKGVQKTFVFTTRARILEIKAKNENGMRNHYTTFQEGLVVMCVLSELNLILKSHIEHLRRGNGFTCGSV